MKFSKMIICTAAAAVLAVGSMTGCAEKSGQAGSETASEDASTEDGQENINVNNFEFKPALISML